MGAHEVRTTFVREFIRPQPGQTILDIGCGPADILDYLPQVDYFGFDISERYIKQARTKYEGRGRFFLKHFDEEDLRTLPSFDVVFCIGVLHHMDKATAKNVLALIKRALKPGGRVVTIDPCYAPGQLPLSKFIVSRDRGQHVRNQEGYAELAKGIFSDCVTQVRHQAWIPYTRCFMECTSS